MPTLGLFLTSILPADAFTVKGWWQIFSKPSLATWSNYSQVLHNHSITHSLITTAEIAVGNTLLVIVIGALAGYAFAWLEFPGRDWIFIVVIGLLVVPLQMALIPMFTLYDKLGIFDTVLSIILFHAAFGLPFAIFLLRNFFIGIPKDILESARIDGASEATDLPAADPAARPARDRLARHLPVPLDLERPDRRADVRAERPADHGRDLLEPAPVRGEHRHHRAGVVHLADRAAGRLLRLPALLRPGAARRLGEVTAPRRCAIVGGGLAGFVSFATLVHGGVDPDDVTVFDASGEDPAAAWRRRALAIRQREMRSESDGHCLPTSFPGLAVRSALKRRNPWPLVQSACDRYHPTVTEFLEHVEELRARTGWDGAVVPERVERIRAVDGGFELEGHGAFRHVLLATGHPGLNVPSELADDPRAVHAYEPHEYADDVAVVGAGMAAATEWRNALAAGARVTSVRRREPERRPLNVPRPLFSRRGLARFHATGPEERAGSSPSCSRPRIRPAAPGTSRSSAQETGSGSPPS